MGIELVILKEVSWKGKTNIIWYHTYVESKIGHWETYLQPRERLTDIEKRLEIAKGKKAGEEKDWESGISRFKLLFTGWMDETV